MKVGSVIQEIRRKKNISQGDLAKHLNLSQTYISQIEGDKRTPSMEVLEAISSALEIPAYYLLFKGLEIEKDIVEEKRDAYEKFSPAVSAMIEGFFIGK